MQKTHIVQQPVRYQIPHLEVEDKIVRVGMVGLTLRQASLLLIGSSVDFNIWKSTVVLEELGTLGMVVRILFVAILALLLMAFAFGCVRGRRLDTWIAVIWRYLWLPKVLLWQRSILGSSPSSKEGV